MSGGAVVEARDAAFSYDGHAILENVTFDIVERDFTTIVGPNGGGKTTLVKLILGLISPTRGTIRVFGVPPSQARRRVGYMPQNPMVEPDFPALVMDVVLMGRLGKRVGPGPYSIDDRDAAMEALREVELCDVRDRPFSDLSGGQRQRALIARALSSHPELLLLDEPTASLDVHMERELYELLHRLNERLTVVLVSHDLGFVSQFAKTVLCVKNTVLSHPTCEVSSDAIRKMYGEDVRIVQHDHDAGCTGVENR